MSTSPVPLNDLVSKIRTKYPGAYDDMDDATLTKAVLAKYPQYSDLAAPKVQPPQVNMQQDPWGIQDNPNQAGAGLPGMTGNRPVTGADLVPGAVAGGAAALAATPTLAAPAIGAAARAVTPAVVAAGNWAEANPTLAKILLEGAKATGYGAAMYKFLKKATTTPSK